MSFLGRSQRVAWLATAFLSGLVLLGSEVVFVRTLVLSLQAKVHSFALMLAVFLVGLSLGSLLAARWTNQAETSCCRWREI